MGWTAGEVLLLPPALRSWWEAGYFGAGLLMAGLGLAIRRAGRQPADHAGGPGYPDTQHKR